MGEEIADTHVSCRNKNCAEKHDSSIAFGQQISTDLREKQRDQNHCSRDQMQLCRQYLFRNL